MNNYLFLGFIGSCILVSLVGLCMADQTPGYIVNIQGGESSITEGQNGTYEITMKDVIPFCNITDANQSLTIPLEQLTYWNYPAPAALVFSGDNNESVSMVTISNLSFSEDSEILTLQVNPLQYYEDERLGSFAVKNLGLDSFVESEFMNLNIYIEFKEPPLENGPNDNLEEKCQSCIFSCGYFESDSEKYGCLQNCELICG